MTSKHVTNVTFLKKYLPSTLHELANFLHDTMKFLFAFAGVETTRTSFLIILLFELFIYNM